MDSGWARIAKSVHSDPNETGSNNRQSKKRDGERIMALMEVGLDDKYRLDAKRIFLSGTQALVRLPLAREQFELLGLEWLAVDALDWEASARGLLEDPLAVALANQALERCRKLEPRPQQIEARILGHLAGMYVVAQSWPLAISYYEAAVEASSAIKDLLQLAKMHHGLGMARQHLNQAARAREHLDKALVLYSIEADQSGVYRVESDLGDLMLHEGLLDSAEQHFMTAMAGACVGRGADECPPRDQCRG